MIVHQKLFTCSLRKGFTTAQYLSADNAHNVKTETPMLTSFAHSVSRHNELPHSQDSNVYIVPTNGTQIRMTSKSAMASEKIYL